MRWYIVRGWMRQAFTCPIVLLGIALAILPAAARAADAEQDAGFEPLFNGESLDGWIGAVDGYEVVNGAIACIPEKGGNLFTEKQYADFVLRLEFQLAPGGNNGIGIRAPLQGRTSREGMEIQVLDDTHEQYADLMDWQAHGSIYGIVPAKRGHLRPTGQWNEQEVICDGSRITVTLNGVVIVDADLDDYRDKPTLDGHEHPGMLRSAGHIGFLGHGTRVMFRNIRVKKLEARTNSPVTQ